MVITFRPNKKFEPFFETLTERGAKSRFLNHAVDFTLSFQPTIEKQTAVIEQLVQEVQCLRKEIQQLKEIGVSAVRAANEHEKTQEEDAQVADYLVAGLGDISL